MSVDFVALLAEMETPSPHQVFKDGVAVSPIFENYEPARRWAIDHKLATEEVGTHYSKVKWMVREPGVEIRFVGFAASTGLEDLL